MDRILPTFAATCFALTFVSSHCLGQDIAGADNNRVYVRVTQNRNLSGTPIELTGLKVTTSFGEVTIPMTKIDGVKLHTDANDSAVIAFKNGDVVTGKIALDTLSIKTDWGKAHIKTAQIEMITSTPNARFYSDVNGGSKNWWFSNGIANGNQ